MRAVVMLVVLVSAAYAISLHAPFVFDDFSSIQTNPLVQSFSFHAKGIFNTRSLLYGTFAFNRWLGGTNVFGYHFVNLLLHIINGLLVLAIARNVYRRLDVSADPTMYAVLAAAFFLLHPVQTEQEK